MPSRNLRYLSARGPDITGMPSLLNPEIVEIAIENDAMIAIENLNSFKPKKRRKARRLNRKLSNWIHGKVKDFTIYKAHWEGIYVNIISPKETSRRCHICGAVGYRSGAIFKCKHGYTSNSDFNASANMALRAKLPEGWGIVNMPVPPRHKAPSVRAEQFTYNLKD